jgi:hypothetical protein
MCLRLRLARLLERLPRRRVRRVLAILLRRGAVGEGEGVRVAVEG